MKHLHNWGIAIYVAACWCCSVALGQAPLTIENQSFPPGIVGQQYLQQLRASGGCTGQTSPLPAFSVVAGALPPGLQIELLSTAGSQIDGVPTTPGTFAFTLKAVDSCQHSATKDFSIAVSASAAPVLALSTQMLTFTYLIGGAAAADQPVQISNKGASALNWSAAPSASWIRASPTSGTAPSTLTVGVSPPSMTPGVYLGTITVTAGAASNSPQSILVSITVEGQPPTPNQFRVSNGASFGTSQAAPGTLASLFASTGASQNFNATEFPLPRSLGGMTLSIGGSLTFDATAAKWGYSSTGSIQAPLLFVGPNQINFQVPPGIAPGTAVPAQLTKPDGTTLLTTLNITAASPGIFTVLQNGQGQAAVLNQDNSRNFGTNPAARGSVIQIFATGGGETTPSLLPGEAAPASGNPLILTNAQPTVTIGVQTATVFFSGTAPGFVGLWQINAEVPQNVTPGNAVPLAVSAGGVASNTATIAVQ